MSSTTVIGQYVIPGWIVKTIVTTIITALIGGATAWGVNLSKSRSDHEKRISVVETKTDAIKEDISEIKDGQKEMNQKLDRLIERRR